MKLATSLVSAALAGLAAAAGASDTADVYLLQSGFQSSTDATPSVPKEVARHILLRRTSRARYGSIFGDIPQTFDLETAISHLNEFGKSRQALFSATDDDEASPAQLVVMLEGITTENAKPLKDALKRRPAFSIADPPSSKANSRLVHNLQASGASSKEGCTLASVVNPNDDSCWSGPSSVVKFDIRKTPDTIYTLIANLDRVYYFVDKGELEATLVLLPESSRNSGANTWDLASSTPADELRRRDSEAVLTDGSAAAQPASTDSASSPAHPFATASAPPHPIPQCFQSQNSCEARTNNCSGGHGVCEDRYGRSGGGKACFSCRCLVEVVSENDNGTERTTVRWAGNMCQKKDVSSPFWLMAGFTITIIGVLSFVIGLLFSVGEEKLPGVIGAGVSRSK